MNIGKAVISYLFLALNFLNSEGQSIEKKIPAGDTIPSRFDTLNAAIATATIHPRMKGDTLDYNVENIHLRRKTVVEDLLKRLPGPQIGMDGTVTYNGEKIQHLLVDGEDIFGSNPTLVTRSFDASKIARIQILDRKSEKAIFTGIDDGTRVRTLNLMMKVSAKAGYFGKIEAGGNTKDIYNANGALAAFHGNEQFTVLGMASNTGELGLTSTSGRCFPIPQCNKQYPARIQLRDNTTKPGTIATRKK